MRGQAALEYLMTYGWAIFALLIVLVALFASGIFSPNYLVAEECSFSNNLKCEFALFNDAGSTKIALRVYNAFPYKIKITDMNLKALEGNQEFTGFSSNIELESGATTEFEGELGGPAVPEGSIKKFVGNITYVSCAPELGSNCSTVEHMVPGRITGRVIPQG